MKYKNYLMSFHGLDIGLIYNLPKNVRVFMYCFAGKEVDAADWNEAATWYMATVNENKYDKYGNFMEDLTLTLNSSNPKSKCAQFCVFSGNLSEFDMNRIPDLYLEDEGEDFKTGLYDLPARFERIFLKDKYSSVDKKFYKPGDKSTINQEKLNKRIKPFIKKGKNLPNDGFISYFINPGSFKFNYKELDFIVVPKSRYYNSYIDLCRKTNKPIYDINIKKQALISLKNKDPIQLKASSFRIPQRKNKNHSLDKHQWDISTPNTSNSREVKKIRKIQNSTKGLYLSDVIRYLCNKNPNKHITLVVSSCRSFHDKIPKNVIKNQQKTATISTTEYVKKYSKIDIK